ncbi:hypothetical protein [Novosphingobium sp. BW1]|uniref:hypothetical protein n=1 Tax=Novosphingobium sp. BW1 TaxID=2592621 RepID=UPI0011DEF277|nr:hypothetical protein [Novosphingobium sp. BW1]TYC86345.1 hypothetical protein FMM79_15555 [Novosphingobium sp. BW1]
MSAPLVQAIQARLRKARYVDLSTPFRVAGVEFAFTGAMRGIEGRALDLILLVDTTTGDFGDRDGLRVRQRVEALSRALDVTASRFVVTVILAGAVLAEGIEALSETCRVLQVEGVALDDQGIPADAAAALQLDDRIRVLLPLTLPAAAGGTTDGAGPAMEQLIRALPAGTDKELLEAAMSASIDGEQAVTDAVASVIMRTLQQDTGETQP